MAGGFLHRLAREMPSRGWQPIVLAPGADGVAYEETLEGVLIRRFRYGHEGRQRIAYTGEMHRAVLRAPIEAWRFGRAFRAAIRREVSAASPPLVHAHWCVPTGWLTAAETWPARTPLVLSLHGTDVRLLRGIPGGAAVGRSVLRRTALALPVSAFLANRLADLRIATKETEILPMPADSDVFRTGDGPRERMFLVAARLARQKRVDVAVRALAHLAARGLDVRLEIAGDGPERASLERLAAAEGMAARVLFHGRLTPEQLAGRMRRAAAVVLPSEEEGYGLVLVEGALSGAPPVGARSGGIPDIIAHERTGLLFEPNDVRGLASAMERLVADERFARLLARAAMERAASWSPGATADRLAHLYGRVLGS
jgi:glycosyltransferase involved in cell wall biosynthesis